MRERGFYEQYVKRILDVICSLLAIVVFFWLYVIIAILVRINLGSPVIFKQPRPGLIDRKTGCEKIFYMYKFRTMTDEKDKDGKILPDEERMTTFGKKLRASSLDELPEAFNILMGDMSVIGPRPQLVKDMVFMDERIRMRHTVKPGLSGLAQINGRNAVTWEQRFEWDLKYLENVTFLNDLRIVALTVKKVFGKGESVNELDITLDYGDALLQEGIVGLDKYNELQNYASNIISEFESRSKS